MGNEEANRVRLGIKGKKQEAGSTEVSQLELSPLIDEQILRLEVSV